MRCRPRQLPRDPEGKTLGEFGVTSTNVAVLEVLLADVGLVRVKSVAEGVLLKLRRRAFNPLSDRSGTDSLRGGVLEPPLFPKRDVPRAGRALPHNPPVLALFLCPRFLQLVPQPPLRPKLKLNPPLLRPDLGSFPGSDPRISSASSC